MAAHRLTCLGDSHGTAPVVVSFDADGELVRRPYQNGFLLHYLDKLVYPNISGTALTVGGVLVCAFNLGMYTRQMWIARRQ